MSIPGAVNPLLLGGGGEEYQIERSLRFNSSDSAYLSRTPASAGNRKTWTWAGWVKRSQLSTLQILFGIRNGVSNTDSFYIGFESNNKIVASSNSSVGLTTAAVFRDVSAWMHLCVVADTNQATAANRLNVYVNGAEVTDFDSATYPSQGDDTGINQALLHEIGRFNASNYFSGYLADIHFIDGQALTPSSFTEVDATTGQLIPKAYTGTYGTNGFRLAFADNSAATATTLGKDTSGNGNNWTPNNLSVTAGAGNDSLVDTPTNGTQTDTGVGGEVVGNYATLNPISNGTGTAPTNGNLNLAVKAAVSTRCNSTIGVSSGKWYFEATLVTAATDIPRTMIGVGQNYLTTTYPGGDALSYGFVLEYGAIYNNNVETTGYGSTLTDGDIFICAFDLDNNKIFFGKNGTWYDSSDPETGTNPAFTLTSGTYSPCTRPRAAGGGGPTPEVAFNFGQRPFAYTAPSGYKALCTANLPDPVVAQPSTVMDVKLYTGNGSTQTISGLGFSPDLVWIKERNAAADHALYDTVRGVQQQLESNTTTDETTESTGLTAFNSDGFALSSLAQVNTNTDTYVAWCWDESATAGFDIVTYTGNGSARTISHGLGVAPNMIIVKARTTASTDQGWAVYHSANTANPETDYLLLNSTAATADLDTVWNDTAPTSSVFSVGTNALVNVNNDTYVAYLFSAVVGYSSFGSYTGNGSADGPFVYTGFRPKVLIYKRTDSSGDWFIWDSLRASYNGANARLFPNSASGEDAFYNPDLLSNGFKLRSSGALNPAANASGGTYIYAAFAESPLQYSRAR